MHGTKRHKVKKEVSEASTSFKKDSEEHDLSYFLHDRVELMHQVFSVLKSKELKILSPECVRRLSLADLQELCTEELLGISSKRLLAILDGAEPPSDTESSSRSPTPQLETISLDSISSDEEILSQHSGKKKKHKHSRRNSKAKKKSKDSKEDDVEKSKASRAGLTVLELLELQARARAIRAQLQQEQALKNTSESAARTDHDSSSENEVEIKEEPAEVVEISSDEEKPKIEDLHKEKQHSPKLTLQTSPKLAETGTNSVTKKVNDLVITVPQAKTTRKIKLNRNKIAVSISNVNKSIESTTIKATVSNTNPAIDKPSSSTIFDAQKKNKKRKKKKKFSKEEDVDNDEITLQLSDSEKMDLLQGLERKISSTEDSESSSDTSEDSDQENNVKSNSSNKNAANKIKDCEKEEGMDVRDIVNESCNLDINDKAQETNCESMNENVSNKKNYEQHGIHTEDSTTQPKDDGKDKQLQTEERDNQPKTNDPVTEIVQENIQITEADNFNEDQKRNKTESNMIEIPTVDDIPLDSDKKEMDSRNDNVSNCMIVEKNKTTASNDKSINKNLSEGELTDRDSSEVELVNLKSDVVCISEDDIEIKKKHKKEKKPKKEKKAKKEKKSKKIKSDFPNDSDQNFYMKNIIESKDNMVVEELIGSSDKEECITLDDDEVQEILELSDDSSCYEVEGTVLSKEPTAEEIEALSVKISEIKREDVVTEEQIIEYEKSFQPNLEQKEETSENLENVSWKDRYLESKKVKKVLTTSNIFNILRRKNKELRLKLEEAKRVEEDKRLEENKLELEREAEKSKAILEEGSIEHYNILESSTKYVDSVKEKTNVEEKDENTEVEKNKKVTNDMKKDAKQLLKMYKKLLKYNDMEKKKDPAKKKKKKNKSKSKEEAKKVE